LQGGSASLITLLQNKVAANHNIIDCCEKRLPLSLISYNNETLLTTKKTNKIMFKKLLILVLLSYSGLTFSSGSFLVDINWLEKNLNSTSIRLIDMSDGTQYQRFHIPGATHLPYSAINIQNKNRVSLSAGKKQIVKILGLLGIKENHHVVIYDDMGGLHASRLFWELEKIGHKKISLLNGGLVKWILAGKKVTADIKNTTAVQYTANMNSGRDNTVSIEEILSSTYNNKNILLDVRSKEEYAGHPRYPRTGHIPKAKWWEWSQAVNFENAFKMQSNEALKKQLKQIGINKPDTPITLYCQSAHRASQSYFTLRQLGFKKVKIYDGSMAEYSKIKTAPLTKGLKP
jgi:thiosulfate/3-mercaptopyruvate sulfurtransferase